MKTHEEYDNRVSDYIYKMRNRFERVEGYQTSGQNGKIQWHAIARPYYDEEFEEDSFDLLTAVKKLYLSLKSKNLHDE